MEFFLITTTTKNKFLLILSTIEADQHLSCVSWAGMERKLIHDAQQVDCTINANCSGISCSIHEFGYDITGGIYVNTCEIPASVTLSIDVPKLNIKKWQKKFYHGDKFSVTETLGGMIEIATKEKDVHNKWFILGLDLDVPSGIKSDSPLLHLIPSLASSTRYQVFKNASVLVPTCSTLNISRNSSGPATTSPLLLNKNKAESNCSILNSSCPVNEMCFQIDRSGPEGSCICLTDFIRDFNGSCIKNPSVSSTTTETPHHSEPHKKPSTKSLLLTAILVPVSVIVIAVALVYLTIRYRVFQHLRRRLRVQVYEHVLLGQEEDEDDEESLNPVA